MDAKNLIVKEHTMNAQEAAKYLGLSVITIQEWCRRGTIPHLKMGIKARFKEADLNSFVENSLVGTEKAG